jgi:hypothetical protein
VFFFFDDSRWRLSPNGDRNELNPFCDDGIPWGFDKGRGVRYLRVLRAFAAKV